MIWSFFAWNLGAVVVKIWNRLGLVFWSYLGILWKSFGLLCGPLDGRGNIFYLFGILCLWELRFDCGFVLGLCLSVCLFLLRFLFAILIFCLQLSRFLSLLELVYGIFQTRVRLCIFFLEIKIKKIFFLAIKQNVY